MKKNMKKLLGLLLALVMALSLAACAGVGDEHLVVIGSQNSADEAGNAFFILNNKNSVTNIHNMPPVNIA